jgi:hypothetical protein
VLGVRWLFDRLLGHVEVVLKCRKGTGGPSLELGIITPFPYRSNSETASLCALTWSSTYCLEKSAPFKPRSLSSIRCCALEIPIGDARLLHLAFQLVGGFGVIGYHRIGELLHLVVALLGSKLAGFNLEQVAAGGFAHEICRFRSDAEGRIDTGLLAERLRQRWPPSAGAMHTQ